MDLNKIIEKGSNLEVEFALLWEQLYPSINLEYDVVFIKDRKYRLDFAHLDAKVGIEIQGQRWKKGGHTSGKGLARDCEKVCLGISEGWTIFPLTDNMITEDYCDLIFKEIHNKIRTANTA